jgi:hypothetical protein
MKPILPLLLTAALAQPDYTAELTAYVDDFLSTVRLMRGFAKRRADAHALIPIVVHYSRAYQVDPLLVGVLISFESSWRTNVTGALGELGALQTMPRYAKMFDLTTPDGQIHAGVSHLRRSLSACGDDLARGVNHYGSGRCEPVGRWVQWRLRAYARAVRRFRR